LGGGLRQASFGVRTGHTFFLTVFFDVIAEVITSVALGTQLSINIRDRTAALRPRMLRV
jgi:hypothetical protein